MHSLYSYLTKVFLSLPRNLSLSKFFHYSLFSQPVLRLEKKRRFGKHPNEHMGQVHNALIPVALPLRMFSKVLLDLKNFEELMGLRGF